MAISASWSMPKAMSWLSVRIGPVMCTFSSLRPMAGAASGGHTVPMGWPWGGLGTAGRRGSRLGIDGPGQVVCDAGDDRGQLDSGSDVVDEVDQHPPWEAASSMLTVTANRATAATLSMAGMSHKLTRWRARGMVCACLVLVVVPCRPGFPAHLRSG